MPFVDDIGRTIASNRQEALRLGLRLYLGAECRHGHEGAPRYAINRRCSECQWETNRPSSRAKRRANAERKRKQRERARKARDLQHLERMPLVRLYLAMLATGPGCLTLL